MGRPSTVTATAAPTSPRLSKFSANASRTRSNPVSQVPCIGDIAQPLAKDPGEYPSTLLSGPSPARRSRRATSPEIRERYSQRSVQRVKQRTGARVDDYAGAHFVHRVAETDFGLRIGETKRTAGARMTKHVRVRTPLIIRLRKHEAAAETRRDQQHLVGPIGFFAIAIRDLFWRHPPDAINVAATRQRAIEPCQRTCRCMAIGSRYFCGSPSARVDHLTPQPVRRIEEDL